MTDTTAQSRCHDHASAALDPHCNCKCHIGAGACSPIVAAQPQPSVIADETAEKLRDGITNVFLLHHREYPNMLEDVCGIVSLTAHQDEALRVQHKDGREYTIHVLPVGELERLRAVAADKMKFRSVPVLTPELVDTTADACVKAVHQLITDQWAYRLRNAIREAINEAVRR